MTLNLLTYVPEGFVLLVDSMSTSQTFVPGAPPKITTFDHAMKLFEIGGGAIRAAAMVSGIGDVDGTLVSQIVKRASIDIENAATINHDLCVNTLSAAVTPLYKGLVAKIKQQTLDQLKADPSGLQRVNIARATEQKPALATLDHTTLERIGIVGIPFTVGQDPDFMIQVPPLEIVIASHIDDYRACVLRWPAATREIVVTGRAQVGNVWWWGSGGSAVARVIKGYDLNRLREEVASGDAAATAAKAYFDGKDLTYQMPMLLSVMPLQEAVNFAEYLGDVACGYDRYAAGPAGVGGAINVMVITDDRREWLRRDRIQTRNFAV